MKHHNSISLLLLLLTIATSKAQSSSELYKQLKKLNFLGSVLYLAAHPDDENTRVISYFSNHILARTAYLSMTRGDGGQNLIGSELREGLGLIRTQELLAARKIDGGSQFFTMANDFGYSKNPKETLSIWDKEKVLEQTLARIQQFKPDIIINRFNSGSSGKTHGHHTASAMISEWAFEQSQTHESTWHPQRLFHNTSWYFYGSRENFEKANKEGMLAIDMGVFDPLTGKTNSEIAALSRSQHKSQGFGSAAALGERIEYLELIKGTKLNSNNPFDGINTQWTRVKGGEPIGKAIEKIIDNFDFSAPYKSAVALLDVKAMIAQLENVHWKAIKTKEIDNLILNCLGVEIQFNAQIPYGVLGEKIQVQFVVNHPSPLNISVLNIQWKDQVFDLNQAVKANKVFRKDYITKVDGTISSPYWLIKKGSQGMYTTNKTRWIGKAKTPAALKASITLVIEGKKLTTNLPLQYRITDPVRGEVITPFQILPEASLQLEAPVQLFATGQNRKIKVSVKNLGPSIEGTLKLETPKSWKLSPKSISISIEGKGNEQNFYFNVKAPQQTTVGHLKPILQTHTKSLCASLEEITYDHFPKQYLISPAQTKAVALNLKIGVQKVGYISGAGDNIPESLTALGVQVKVLEAKNITLEKLNPFDAVVVGIRAFNVKEALGFKNQVLWDYAEAGGNLLIQYNTNRRLKTKAISPLPLNLSRDRVSNEKALVQIIHPKHPIMNHPNKITSEDFKGWVQERGLYFPNQWDDQFTPLLQMNDEGESPKKGALLVAPYGKGRVVYTGLSFFRQLPAGVSGAYRLFFNLIAQP
ncbi:PIG-L family deacetylase [Flavobacteriaceae bacterium]|nr:PIG-L family deacetylase [Flavobacteriaceae bacterium]